MINKFKIFIKVAESGSFSRAGKILQLTPSSVSRAIDRLEEELNIKLFNRSTRHLALTEAGEQLLDSARKLVLDFDAVVASTQPDKAEPEGKVKISVFESFGRLILCPLIPTFLAMYPKVKIDISLDNNVIDLYRDDVDLAIRIGYPEDSGLKIRKLSTNRMVVCASKTYFEKNGKPAHPNDLSEHNCLLINQNRQSPRWYFRKKDEHHKVQVSGNMVATGGTPLLEAAKQGIGILLLSEWMFREELKSGELVAVLDSWESSLFEQGSGDIFLVFLEDKYMKPALRLFIDFVMQHLK